MNFLAELRRRKVFRVAGVYAVVGWLLAQAAALLEGAIGLPSWFDGFVVSVLFLGLPVAVVLAWALEMTPEGLRRTAPATDGAPASDKTLAGADIALLAALVVLIAVSVFQAFRGPPASSASVETAAFATVAPPAVAEADARPSIAVLPFVNMSSDQEQEYFSDGLSEELLNQLSKVDGLRVIARTSSFAFKNQTADARTIGDALGVTTLLEGSVRKSGDRLRITAQLIDVSDGAHLWSNTYDREVDDVFAVQDEISVAVTDALSVTFGLASQRTDPGGTTNFVAYESYLRGEAAFAEGGLTNLTAAMEAYQRAVEIDPDFALAWTALADLMSFMAIADGTNAATYLQLRRDATAQALAVAPALPEAHVSRMFQLLDERDWAGAGRAAAESARLEPGGDAELDAVVYNVFVGRMGKALPYGDDWLRRDPLSLTISQQVATMFYWAGEEELARAEFERGLDLAGDHTYWAYQRLLWLMTTADAAAVDDFLASTTFPSGPDGRPSSFPARLRQVLTSPADGRALVQELRDDPAFGGPTGFGMLAAIAGYFGDPDLAVELLHENYFVRNSNIPQLMWEPILADARRTEAFKPIVRDLGLVDFWRESGDWGDFCRPVGEEDFECF